MKVSCEPLFMGGIKKSSHLDSDQFLTLCLFSLDLTTQKHIPRNRKNIMNT